MSVIEILLAMKHELTLAAILFLLLFIKLQSDSDNNTFMLRLANILLWIPVLFIFLPTVEVSLFGQMFHVNTSTNYQKSFLAFGLLIISAFSYTWLHTHKNAMEFYLLLISSLLGMYFMISAGNLLMFYLGLELSTIPLAAAANFDLEKRKSSEAAMKLIFSSAFSSALLLLGISFVYGATGTIQFNEMTLLLQHNPLTIFGFVLLFTGFAFKISAVPFHLWTADVYEGSPIAVTAFLSVISKGAVVFVFVTVLYQVFKPLADIWYAMVVLLAVLSIVVGNLFALRQVNMKRFLAFSSIAQIGYVLIGVSGSSSIGSASVFYFLLVYLFSNLAAFGVISVISNIHGKEEIKDYKGLYKTNPLLAWILAIALFSLAGVPPTAGFFGKFFLILSGAGAGNYLLIVIAALNMVVSFYYYLQIVRVMFMDSGTSQIPLTKPGYYASMALWICVAGIIVTGIIGYFYEYITLLSPIY